ncbi:MAG: hypothetical protein MUO34_11870 [Ignavibacteriaceae bacterium]|nr:hypothetical protein [Ignavibacteriaceae bacterium]
MATLPPPGVKEFPADSLEKKVYGIVETLSQYIPVPNDRNRLGYCLFKYMIGEGDEPKIALKSAKINVEGISTKDLAKKIDEELKKI